MANLKDLIVNGASRFIGKTYINDSSIGTINGSTVGDNPKFTDTVDLASMTGVLSTAKGGTGASTIAGARSNLGITPANIGAVATSAVTSAVGNNTNIPTGAAVQTYVTGLGYGKGTVGGNGTSSYIAKWTGTTAIGNGPKLGGTSATTTFLSQAGTWLTPPNTTYSSKTAAQNGTDVSLVTTGEKYTWNQKTSNTGTVTSIATGTGLTGGPVTTSGTISHIAGIGTSGTIGSGTTSDSSGQIIQVPFATYDSMGHITAKGTYNHTVNSLPASAISSGTFATARIPNLPASIITSGTFATARIPSLPASIITSGTLATARIPTVPVAKGGTGATNNTAALSNLFGVPWDFSIVNTTDTFVPVFTDNNGPIQHRQIPLAYNQVPLTIENGGTGSTTRLEAAKALTNQKVGTDATHFVTLTTSWDSFGYTDISDTKKVLGIDVINSGFTTSAGSSKSVPNTTVTQLMSTTLATAGTYLINFGTSFSTNASGYRQLCINTTSSSSFTWNRYAISQPGVSSITTNLQGTSMVTTSSANTVYYLWAKQNSGSALTCYPYIDVIRLR